MELPLANVDQDTLFPFLCDQIVRMDEDFNCVLYSSKQNDLDRAETALCAIFKFFEKLAKEKGYITSHELSNIFNSKSFLGPIVVFATKKREQEDNPMNDEEEESDAN